MRRLRHTGPLWVTVILVATTSCRFAERLNSRLRLPVKNFVDSCGNIILDQPRTEKEIWPATNSLYGHFKAAFLRSGAAVEAVVESPSHPKCTLTKRVAPRHSNRNIETAGILSLESRDLVKRLELPKKGRPRSLPFPRPEGSRKKANPELALHHIIPLGELRDFHNLLLRHDMSLYNLLFRAAQTALPDYVGYRPSVTDIKNEITSTRCTAGADTTLNSIANALPAYSNPYHLLEHGAKSRLNFLQRAILWFPANLVEGPAGLIRRNDPHMSVASTSKEDGDFVDWEALLLSGRASHLSMLYRCVRTYTSRASNDTLDGRHDAKLRRWAAGFFAVQLYADALDCRTFAMRVKQAARRRGTQRFIGIKDRTDFCAPLWFPDSQAAWTSAHEHFVGEAAPHNNQKSTRQTKRSNKLAARMKRESWELSQTAVATLLYERDLDTGGSPFDDASARPGVSGYNASYVKAIIQRHLKQDPKYHGTDLSMLTQLQDIASLLNVNVPKANVSMLSVCDMS